MSYTYWLSRRLRLNGSSRGVNSTGVGIAVVGIAIAVIVMEFTIAVVLGFRNQITQRIESFDGDVWVLPAYSYESVASAPSIGSDARLDSVIQSVVPGAAVHMRFYQPGIIKTDDNFAGLYFTGDDDPTYSANISDYIVEGKRPDFSSAEDANKVILSTAVANDLNLSVGDRITAFFFVNDAIKARRFDVCALYDTGFSDYDRSIVLASINSLRKIGGVDSVSGSRLMIDLPEGKDIEAKAATLQDAFIKSYRDGEMDNLYPVDNVRHTGAMYFNWLDLLNTNVVAIFVLMVCVSGFTLISSMFIIILERIPTIGVLRAMGATKRQIRAIFIDMTLRIVAIGLVIGNAVGLGLLCAQYHWRIIPLDSEMYYLRHVPVELAWGHFALLNVGVVIMAWLLLILPSRVASDISPASTMRFE